MRSRLEFLAFYLLHWVIKSQPTLLQCGKRQHGKQDETEGNLKNTDDSARSKVWLVQTEDERTRGRDRVEDRLHETEWQTGRERQFDGWDVMKRWNSSPIISEVVLVSEVPLKPWYGGLSCGHVFQLVQPGLYFSQSAVHSSFAFSDTITGNLKITKSPKATYKYGSIELNTFQPKWCIFTFDQSLSNNSCLWCISWHVKKCFKVSDGHYFFLYPTFTYSSLVRLVSEEAGWSLRTELAG